jgi:hypothetical protein
MQTDLAVGPAGDVSVMNNWQDIDSCVGRPSEVLRRAHDRPLLQAVAANHGTVAKHVEVAMVFPRWNTEVLEE